MICDAELWRDQVAALRGHARCIVPALDAATTETMADEVLRSAPERFALAGLSMGGYVALAIMREAPERVTRLLLAHTGARPDTPEQSAGRQAASAAVKAGKFDRVVERLLGVTVHPSRLADALMLQRIEAMLRRMGPEMFVRQQLAAAGRPDSRPGLGEITVPTCVVAGDADRVIPPDNAIELAAAIPGAGLTMIEDCGHLSPIERPDHFNDVLLRWITG
jgi:pimeloyl-ACP methyl ester carboxylesterase